MNRIQIISIEDVVESQSRPYIVMGDDLNVYYSKFAVGSSDTIDLYYEFVCKEIGELLGIPIPEACLMEYNPEPFITEFPELNTTLLGFGSKELSPNQIITGNTDFIKN